MGHFSKQQKKIENFSALERKKLAEIQNGATYFKMKAAFGILQNRILEIARAKVRNGEFTERGLGRHLGVSQAHLHNVLAGIRPVTPALLDVMLRGFGMSLLDLFTTDELSQHLLARGPRSG